MPKSLHEKAQKKSGLKESTKDLVDPLPHSQKVLPNPNRTFRSSVSSSDSAFADFVGRGCVGGSGVAVQPSVGIPSYLRRRSAASQNPEKNCRRWEYRNLAIQNLECTNSEIED